jgi:hypothetical protein
VRFITTKKALAALATGAVVIAASGVAFAYWTTSGSGPGSGSVAASNGTLGLIGTSSPALTPGGSTTVTVKATNAGSTNLAVATIHLDSVTGTGCVGADFSMPDIASGIVVPAHTDAAHAVTVGSGTLSYADSLTSNQTACQGAALTLALSATTP